MSTHREASQGEPSTPTTTSTSTASITLPSISAFYNNNDLTISSTATTSSSSPGHLAVPFLPPPGPVRYPSSSEADNASWISPANTAELAEDADNYNNNDYDSEDTNFVYENGRRYHANADGRVLYPLPNDESEQERDDMKHKLALWMMHEKLFYAPVEERLALRGIVFDLGELFGPLQRLSVFVVRDVLHSFSLCRSLVLDRGVGGAFSDLPVCVHQQSSCRCRAETGTHTY